MKGWFYFFLFLTFFGPIGLLVSGNINLRGNYLTANRDSAGVSPDPQEVSDAVVEVFSARAFSWRGMFAEHTWIAVKPQYATHYTVYQVIGWRLLQGLSPLIVDQDFPDRNWFGKTPSIIFDVRGDAAEQLIPKIAHAVSQYPYANDYTNWPGPNSNTFTAYVGRQIPEMRLVMPANAIGKDYLLPSVFYAPTPSGTGFQVSLYGLLGLTVAKLEGVEINILGLVYGFSWATKTLKLPGFGDIMFGGAKQR